MEQHPCQVCQKLYNKPQLYLIELLRPSTIDLLKKEHDPIDTNGYICSTDLHKVRSLQIKKLLNKEKGSLSEGELDVIESIKKQEILSENTNLEFVSKLSFGDKVADKVAAFGGSWYFIFTFLGFMTLWMSINVSYLFESNFDPYPFILLNLILSCLAAFQAPVIMMSQNRQALKEKVKSDHEYAINLKAELQTRLIESKLDRFMNQEWGRLLEIQEVLLELSEAILDKEDDKSS